MRGVAFASQVAGAKLICGIVGGVEKSIDAIDDETELDEPELNVEDEADEISSEGNVKSHAAKTKVAIAIVKGMLNVFIIRIKP